MNRHPSLQRLSHNLVLMSACAGLAFSSGGQAASLNLATAPLANSTTVQVLPNIMFTLDDSGSMDWDFMPDWVGYDYSRASQPNLYRNSAWNVTYYNPAVTYSPPVFFNANGTQNTTTYPGMTAANTTNWTAVKYDSFGIQRYSEIAVPTTTALMAPIQPVIRRMAPVISQTVEPTSSPSWRASTARRRT